MATRTCSRRVWWPYGRSDFSRVANARLPLAARRRTAIPLVQMAPSTATSLRGGRFRVLGTLGEGAQGRTFDGVDAREGRPVAIKRFDVRGATAWKDVELA